MHKPSPAPASTARPVPGRAAWLRRWVTGAQARVDEPLVGHRIDWPRAVPFIALHAGFLTGLAYVAMSFGINYAFAGRSFKLWLIDGGYHTLQFTLYGLILGLWH